MGRRKERIDYLITFGERIAARRDEQGISRQQLAERIGISVTSLAHIEQGYNEPSFTTLIHVCTVLGVTFEDLVEGLALPPKR